MRQLDCAIDILYKTRMPEEKKPIPKYVRIVIGVIFGGCLGLAIAVFLPPGDAGPDFEVVRKTKHLEIYTNLEPKPLDHYERLFEGFIKVFSERYFEVNQKRRLKMYLIGNQDNYREFVKANFPRHTTPFGFFSASKNMIVINLSRGLGTATHELVHHFRHVAFARRPPTWVDEGFASFFEKFIGYIDDQGELHIYLGYFSNWRFPDTQARLASIGLKTLTSFNSKDQGVARTVMLFLHRKNLLVKFIRRAKDGCRKDCLAELSEIYGADLATFERDWKAWIAAQTDLRDIKMVPLAFISNQESWDSWLESNKDRYSWSDEQQRYVPLEK
jgi:hypothetical protein